MPILFVAESSKDITVMTRNTTHHNTLTVMTRNITHHNTLTNVTNPNLQVQVMSALKVD